MTFYPWGPWRPDQGGPDKPFCETAQGVIPILTAKKFGYGPFPSLVTATGAEALSGEPRGVISVQKFDGTWSVIAATASTIELQDSSFQWSDIETGRTVTSGYDVSFAHFGSSLYNTDTTSGLKSYNVETPAGNNAVAGAPSAVASIFSCNNVLFALNVGGNNRRFQSSKRGDPTTWVGGGADGKTFEDGGALIAGGDLQNGRGIMCQDRCLRLIQFGVGPALYAVTKIAFGFGLVKERNLVIHDASAWGWDREGPWEYTAGGQPVRIGAEKNARWALANIGASNYGNLQGVVDPSRHLVMWRIDSATVIAYNYLIKEWSILPFASAWLTRLATPGVTIDNLSGTIDAQTLVIDNPLWAGSAPSLGALDTSYKFATFAGSNMAALLESCRITDDSEMLLKWVKPESDASSSTMTVGTATSLDAAMMYGSAKSKGSHGWTEQRTRGRIFGFKETIPSGASWTYANGFEIGGGPKQ